jgi:hypothetical protein
MYPVSENTPPNATFNPTFELAYWRFGFNIAAQWKTRQKLPVSDSWLHVAQNLAPLPTFNDSYPIYEGIPNMWVDPNTYYDHPAMIDLRPASSNSRSQSHDYVKYCRQNSRNLELCKSFRMGLSHASYERRETWKARESGGVSAGC